MNKLYLIPAVVFLFCSVNIPADGADDVVLPETMYADGTRLDLNGSGTQIKFIIKIYVAGLYLPSPSANAVQIIQSDSPMAIRLHFIQNASGNRIVTSWNKSFDRVAEDGYPTGQKNRELFNEVFSSGVRKNGVYDIIYVPGKGTMVYLDGNLQSEIQGIEFKKAVFAFWLGSIPAGTELKEALLGLS